MYLFRDFLSYFKAVFTEGQPLVFAAFDIIGIVLFFFPQIAESLVKDLALTRAVGGFIFFASFLFANFSLYRRLKQDVVSSLNEQSLKIYPHKNPPYNAAKMIYVGSEIAKDLDVQVLYRDTSGIEQIKVVKEFFPKEDPKMWQHYYDYDFLEPNQVAYFHLVGKEHTKDGRVTVVVKFAGATSGEFVQVKREFQLQSF